MDYIILLIGFALLIKGADFFVEGASGLAKVLKISPLLIGLTIVAFGTSAPEAAVSISAALAGNNGIAIGNILGSNIVNATFIIGISALFFPLVVERQTIRKEIPLTLLSALALLILGNDLFFSNGTEMTLSRGDGLMLLLLFVIFMSYIFESAKASREKDYTLPTDGKSLSTPLLLLFTFGGMVAVIFGGQLVVSSATDIALSFGLSETLIGLTIVAIGTSLPELITSLVASIKQKPELAVGNIVGSNIFNVLFILGISASLKPITFDSTLIVELLLNVVITIVLLLFSTTGKKITRMEGFLLVSIYAGYMVYLIGNHFTLF